MDALVEETRNGRDALVASAHAGRCMDYQGWGRGIKPPRSGDLIFLLYWAHEKSGIVLRGFRGGLRRRGDVVCGQRTRRRRGLRDERGDRRADTRPGEPPRRETRRPGPLSPWRVVARDAASPERRAGEARHVRDVWNGCEADPAAERGPQPSRGLGAGGCGHLGDAAAHAACREGADPGRRRASGGLERILPGGEPGCRAHRGGGGRAFRARDA